MKALKIDIEQLQKAMEKMKCVELYYFKHQLYEYDELKMQYMMLWIKQKATNTLVTEIDAQWNLVQDMIVIDLDEIFAKHSGDQELQQIKLKFYKKKYLNFIYQSLVQALKHRANNLDLKISRTK